MDLLATVLDWLIILAFLGFIGALCAIGITAVGLKNQAMSSYKRLTSRPIERVKMIAVTGKGIGQQEGVRLRRMSKSAKRAADAVKVTVEEAKVAVDNIKEADLEPLLKNAETAFKFATAAASLARAAANQGKH